MSSILSALQLFLVGLTVGVGFQCFFVCAPLILPYVAAVNNDWLQSLKDMGLLITGRVLAYVILGAIAGYSGAQIDSLINSGAAHILKIVAGAIIVLLGLSIALGLGFKIGPCAYLNRNRFLKGAGLLLTGFVIGISPCLPLLSVIFEITLISKTPLAGAAYAFSFGAGTALASFITVGPLAAAFGHYPSKMLKNTALQAAFRVACGILVILFGIALIKNSRP